MEPQKFTRSDTRFAYTTLFLSDRLDRGMQKGDDGARQHDGDKEAGEARGPFSQSYDEREGAGANCKSGELQAPERGEIGRPLGYEVRGHRFHRQAQEILHLARSEEHTTELQ